ASAARRARCCARSSSRSIATAFMRALSGSPLSDVISVITVTNTAIDTTSAATKEGSVTASATSLIMRSPLELEIHHLLHHEDDHGHPQAGDDQDEVARRMDEERHDVARARQVDEEGDDERQCADDDGGCLRFHRQRLDLRLHLLAVAQHLRQVAKRLGE